MASAFVRKESLETKDDTAEIDIDLARLSLGSRTNDQENSSTEKKQCRKGFELKVSKENELRNLQLTSFLIKASSKKHETLLRLSQLLFLHLQTLHQIYHQTDDFNIGSRFISSHDEEGNIETLCEMFESPCMSVVFGIELFKGLFKKICQILPAAVPFLEKNNCLAKCCPKIFLKADKTRASQSRDSFAGRSSMPLKNISSNDATHDVFDSIAYADRRDSRNFSSHSHLHANQQKIRDAFLEIVRLTAPDFAPSPFLFPSKSSKYQNSYNIDLVFKSKELLSKLMWENYEWFADLLIFHYEQIRKRQPVGDLDRLEKLEERLTKASGSLKPQTKLSSIESNIVAQIIDSTDSHRLHVHLSRRIWKLMHLSELTMINGKRNNASEEIHKMCHLAKLAAFLDSSGDEFRGDFSEPLLEAYVNGHLCIRLTWILAYLREIPSVIAAASYPVLNSFRQSNLFVGNPRVGLYIYILIDAFLSKLPSEERQNIGIVELPEKPIFQDISEPMNSCIDSDINFDIDLFVQNECPSYAMLFSILRNTKVFDMNSSPTKVLAVGSLEEPKQPTRKIRPITIQPLSKENQPDTVSNVKKKEETQAKLRSWYWWQWPDFKEITDSLLRYAISHASVSTKVVSLKPKTPPSPDDIESEGSENVGSSPSEQTESRKMPSIENKVIELEIRGILESCLPSLMPPILKDNKRALALAVALTLEKAHEFLQNLV